MIAILYYFGFRILELWSIAIFNQRTIESPYFQYI